jgi:hypothetical protein
MLPALWGGNPQVVQGFALDAAGGVRAKAIYSAICLMIQIFLDIILAYAG